MIEERYRRQIDELYAQRRKRRRRHSKSRETALLSHWPFAAWHFAALKFTDEKAHYLPFFPFCSAMALAVGAASCQQPADQPKVPPQTDSTAKTSAAEYPVRPDKDSPLRLDVYEPIDAGTEPRPAIILIHGGGWISFDKSTMQRMGEFLARSGFVAFAVDYRLFQGSRGEPLAGPTGRRAAGGSLDPEPPMPESTA